MPQLTRRSRAALGAASMFLLFGLLGLGWWSWRHSRGRRPSARFHGARVAVAGVCLVLIAVGTVWRTVPLFQSVPPCSPGGTVVAGAVRASPYGPSLFSQQVATWPETGLGLLYSHFRGARVCLSRLADYLVALHADNIAGTKAMNMGDIVLTPGFNISADQRDRLIQHEARHRAQWAVATLIGGPFAFPVAYAVENFFFPGSRNLFERQAGLGAGGYRHVGLGPVLGPAQFAALGVAAVIIIAIVIWRRRRRRDHPFIPLG